ncbi:hypothetical protein PBCVCVB1_773L [Paramecium bursaria Chlorella virus CVB-1]|nr:hypothetical protein PBCVCVB1_773L [Paramecium bursaria Chlorella virus CVB-1]
MTMSPSTVATWEQVSITISGAPFRYVLPLTTTDDILVLDENGVISVGVLFSRIVRWLEYESTKRRRATSVWLPTPCASVRNADELMEQFLRMSSKSAFMFPMGGVWLNMVLFSTHFTTDILFSVSVPVLSLRSIEVLPRVSQAERWRTKRLSCSIFLTEYVRVIMTAAGSPSGRPTTMIVIENTMYLRGPLDTGGLGSIVDHRTVWAMNTDILTHSATIPHHLTKRRILFWSGVFPDSFWTRARVRPNSLFCPTAMTYMDPMPSVTTLPERSQGSVSKFLKMVMPSPVSADSSRPSLFVVTRYPSAGTLSPADKITRSPTTRSLLDICISLPSRITFTM